LIEPGRKPQKTARRKRGQVKKPGQQGDQISASPLLAAGHYQGKTPMQTGLRGTQQLVETFFQFVTTPDAPYAS